MNKKLLLVLIALVLTWSMTACGRSSGNDTEPVNEPQTEMADVTTVKEGTLIMSTNAYYPPYEYYDGDRIVGIDAEIAEALADKLGLELEIRDVNFNDILTEVAGGTADIGMSGFTITDDRRKKVLFSDSYASGSQVVIVQEDSDITSLDDLYEGKDVGVLVSSTAEQYCREDFGREHVKTYPTGGAAVEDLLTGNLDAVVIDDEPAKTYVSEHGSLIILETDYIQEDYAIAINLQNTALRDRINSLLRQMKSDGTLDAIISKYIRAE